MAKRTASAQPSPAPAVGPLKHGPGRPRRTEPTTASTLRLPPEYWRRCRIAAAIHETRVVGIVQRALDEWFQHHPLAQEIERI